MTTTSATTFPLLARSCATSGSRRNKARRVVDLIRGRSVNDAQAILSFAPQAAAEPVLKLLNSAVANAEVRLGETAGELSVYRAFVDEGTTWKRIRPRSRSQAFRILKRSSHITLVVASTEAAATAAGRPVTSNAARARLSNPRTSSRAANIQTSVEGKEDVLQEREGEQLVGQKVNPHGFRLGISTDHKSRWYAEKLYKAYVGEDVAIRRLLGKGMERAGISKVEIERTRDRVRIDIHTARPGIVIGRRGAEAERLRGELEKLTGKQVQLNILEVKNPEVDAQLVAQGVAEQLSARRRVPSRDAQVAAVRTPGRRRGHPHPVLRPPRRRRDEPVGVLPRGPGSAAHAARRHRLRLLRGPHPVRPDRRQGLDLQG